MCEERKQKQGGHAVVDLETFGQPHRRWLRARGTGYSHVKNKSYIAL